MDKRKLLLLVIAIFLVVVFLAYFFKFGPGRQSNAVLEGRVFDISPQVSGLIKEVNVQDNFAVSRDFVLFNIDPAPYQAEYERAAASLLALQQGIPSADAEFGQGLVEWEQRIRKALEVEKKTLSTVEELSTALASATFQRRKAESGGNKQLREKARQLEAELSAKLAMAKQQQDIASTARNKAEQDLAQIKEQMEENRGAQLQAMLAHQMNAAKLRLELAQQNLNNTQVRSPVDGYVLEVTVKPGQEAVAGQKMLQVVPLDPESLWLTTFFPPEQAAKLEPEQECDVLFIDLPDVPLKGKIDSIRAATSGLLPLSNSGSGGQSKDFADKFAKEGNMVAVKVLLLNYDPANMPPLRLGMEAKVTP